MAQDSSLTNINDMYCDVLREIGNIGAGNATTAVANMVNLRLDMQVPQVRLMTLQELPAALGNEEELICGIYLEVMNDIEGSMMFMVDMHSARFFVDKLMGTDDPENFDFSEMELSALKEIGNIIAASYLSAVASLTNLVISPSVPYLAVDMAAAILSVPATEFGVYGDNALMIETHFGDDFNLNGYFILMPDIDSYEKILKSLGITM
ncbi:MAG: chemotaxis protein CheC [Eubacterium sp.]|nr:chemotaxis protein CheC [Eubacterium sp.]